MRYLCRAKSFPLAIFCLAIAIGVLPSEAKQPQQLWIAVVDEQTCVVEEARILCVDVLRHLREVVKLPAGSIVRLRVEDTATTATDGAIMKVSELILNSEYRTPIGVMDVSQLSDQ
jgi:hypothetical protein